MTIFLEQSSTAPDDTLLPLHRKTRTQGPQPVHKFMEMGQVKSTWECVYLSTSQGRNGGARCQAGTAFPGCEEVRGPPLGKSVSVHGFAAYILRKTALKPLSFSPQFLHIHQCRER